MRRFRPPRRAATAAAALALVASVLVGCAPRPDDAADLALLGRERRDVLLVTIDTWRHDATGFSGAGKVETPAIDRVAGTGRTWPFAHAHAVVTLPSHATLLTGLLPYEHAIRDNAGFVLPASVPTLAERLRDEGYRTAAFVSAYPLDRRFGLARGFEVYDDAYEGHAAQEFSFPERPADRTVRLALDWWDSQAEGQRFLWVHVFTPHFPYEPPEPWASRYAGNPYYGEVAAADAHLAPILARATDDRAVVLITADHGESLGEHGEATHGVFAYEATLRVPFVLSAPGLVRPGVDERDARLVDVAPTLLDLLGLPPLARTSGSSLLAPAPADPGTYFEALSPHLNRGWAPLYGRIDERVKAIDLPLPELYDLRDDPGESANRFDRQRSRFDGIVARIAEDAFGPVDRGSVAADVAERLGGLGYVAATAPARDGFDYGPDDDPKRRIGDQERLFEALTLYRDGQAERAIAGLRALVAAQPRMSSAYAHLGFMLADLGRLDEAAAVLEAGAREGADSEPLRRRWALVLMRLGRAEEAWAVLAPHGDSNDPETQVALARVAATAGRGGEAEARIRRALELDPTYPEALVDRGIVLMMQGRFDEAEREIRRGLEGDPEQAEGWNALGVIRSRAGDAAGAVAAWRRAVALDPRLPDALYNLALLLAKDGQTGEAAGLLERYAALSVGEERQRVERMLAQLHDGG